jgi:4-amino-4-deoxy-L-arabinose transferase-like glycosyltransferase
MAKDADVRVGGQGRTYWGAALLLALAFGSLASIHLDRPGFFDNEGRYAEVAREMLVRHDLVTPEMNQTLFLNKPPLMYWLAAGAFTLGARDEWARVASVLAAMVSVFFTCRLGARLFDDVTGLIAGAFLATMFGFVLEARTLRPDGVLVASVVAALYCWRLAEGAPDRRRAPWLALGWASLAIGFMAKGAVPVAVVAIPVVVCTVRDHGLRGLWRLQPLAGSAVFLLVAAPWHVAVAMRHPGFAWDYVVNQHLLFFFDKKLPRDSVGDSLKVFWSMFLGRGLPWIVLVPFTVREALRGRRRDAGAIEHGVFFCWTWIAGIMLMFSAAPSRLEHYSLPTLPAVALLAARGSRRLAAGVVGPLAWVWLGTIAVVLLAAGTVGAFWAHDLLARVYWIKAMPALLDLLPASTVVTLLGGAILAWAVRRHTAAGVGIALVTVGLPMMAIVLRAQAEAEPFFSWRPLARVIDARIPGSVEIVFEAPEEYQIIGALAYYTRRHITMLAPPRFTPPTYLEPYRDALFLERGEFARRWSGPDALAFVSDPQRRRDTPDGLVPGPFHVLDRSGDRWLLTNRDIIGTRSAG